MKILDIPKSGKCGQVVAFQSRFGLCLRQWLMPHNTMTPARQHMRSVFGNNSRMWSGGLSEEQRDRWNAAGPKVMSYPRLSQKGPLTGQQFWQSINSVRGCVGLPPVSEPPTPVLFAASVVGPLEITNDEDGVRLWLAVSGDLPEDVMVFGQEPCSSGRSKRRNVSFLGLLPPPVGGRIEITQLYKARFGEPRPGRKVFVVTCQQKEGWKGMEREASATVPEPPKGQQAVSEGATLQNPYMYKGSTRDAEGTGAPAVGHAPGSIEPAVEGGKAAKAGLSGDGGGGGGDG